MTRLTLTDLNPDEHNQGLHCYPFKTKSNGCIGSCNAPENLSSRICFSKKKTEYVNLNVFKLVKGIKE